MNDEPYVREYVKYNGHEYCILTGHDGSHWQVSVLFRHWKAGHPCWRVIHSLSARQAKPFGRNWNVSAPEKNT